MKLINLGELKMKTNLKKITILIFFVAIFTMNCIKNDQSKHGSDNLLIWIITNQQNQQSQTGSQTNKNVTGNNSTEELQ